MDVGFPFSAWFFVTLVALAFLDAYVSIVARWNLSILEMLIDAGVDVVVRRGWYESTDFWSPGLYRRFLFDPLRREVQTAHQAGVKVSYVMNSGAMPLLPLFRELEFDGGEISAGIHYRDNTLSKGSLRKYNLNDFTFVERQGHEMAVPVFEKKERLRKRNSAYPVILLQLGAFCTALLLCHRERLKGARRSRVFWIASLRSQ